jgi:hypothetical protein
VQLGLAHRRLGNGRELHHATMRTSTTKKNRGDPLGTVGAAAARATDGARLPETAEDRLPPGTVGGAAAEAGGRGAGRLSRTGGGLPATRRPRSLR